MILNKRKLMQSIMAVLLGTSSAYGQYNVDHLVGPYDDNAVLTSVAEVGNGNVISVGTITTPTISGAQQKDILITKTDSMGNLVWNYRYGQPDQVETGHGVTLNWNGDHVIVVGSMYYSGASGIGNPSVPLRDAITLKVRISDGALIWTTTHGTYSNDEEALLIERTNDGIIGDRTYVVVGRSSGDPAQSAVRMYAFKLNESGGEVWSRRYLLSNNFPIISVSPSSVVSNGFSKLMIAGIQSEVNRPTTLFTTGISSIDGSVTDDFVEYTNPDIYHVKDCAIARDPDGSGFALAFTTDNFYGPCLAVSTDPFLTSVDRIGVMRLYPSRKVQWTSIYWRPQSNDQRGVAIDIKGGLYNIATSYDMGNVERPGFVRINKANSTVVDGHIYYSSSFNSLSINANCMIPTKDGGYIMKTFVQPDDGFSLINMNAFGQSSCDQEVSISKCGTQSTADAKKSQAINYGSVALNYSPRYFVPVNSQHCISPIGAKSNSAAVEAPTAKMVIYPSPVSENEEIVNIKFSTKVDNAEATVHVYNSLGQEVLTYDITTKEGENQTHFNAQKLSPGMHTVVIDTDREILDRGKLLKQ